MDLAAVISFLVMYYLRPQEWLSLFSTIHFVQLVMIVAIGSLFTRERPLRGEDIFKTPHDWAILAFTIWIVISSSTPFETLKAFYPFPLFYLAIVHILYNVERMKVFIGWWTVLIVLIACLAIASEYGFDPLGGHDVTHGRMKDRLMLNLSIFNNPNGLGHSVVPSIAMLYFFCIWKRPLVLKQIGFALLGIPLWCIYLTVSKGAFLCGAMTVLLTAIFGRPKTVQVLVLSVALMGGSVALYKLPRMSELNRSKGDPAIQGRVAAFRHGLKMITTTKAGVGYGNWTTSFLKAHKYSKAAHSSYVQIGAELGYPGFFLMIGILYCNLRTLLTARTTTEDEERVRRTLFVLVASYVVSSWMVDFGYRPTFFMFTAACAAFHRHLAGISKAPLPLTLEELREAALPAWQRRLQPAVAATPLGLELAASTGSLAPVLALAPATTTAVASAPVVSALPARPLPAWRQLRQSPATTAGASAEAEPEAAPILTWNRPTWFDLAAVTVLTVAAVRFWTYMVSRM